MSISITQNPAAVSLAQSPIIFTVAESNGALITSSSFQYVGELYYWTGSASSSGSADYTISKFPNTATVGIFDLNRIINSTLTDLLIQNTSNVVYFNVWFYTQYYNGSSFVTGSNVQSSTYKALDGYGIFPEPIGQAVYSKTPYWPLMTDAPTTQSVLIDDIGYSGVYIGDAGTTQPTKLVYTSNLTTAETYFTASTATSGQIASYATSPSSSGFPLSTTNLEYYTIQAYNGSTPLGTKLRYDVVCKQKYPNVRISWKNRYGQFDWYSFYMVNRKSFQTEKKTYQPQLGTWEGSTLSYQSYDSSNLNYIVDSTQTLQVNTFWLDDDYNDWFKQLLVSDEIYYWDGTTARPLTIATSNIQFKTGVNDKLIQYQFDFNLGQNYKLIM
jgi:hypothetical protein